VSFIAPLIGLSPTDVCLPKEAVFSGITRLGIFFEKFLDARLLKPVPGVNWSVRDVVLRIPGLFAKGFVDVKNGFLLSTVPPAAWSCASGSRMSSLVVTLAAPGLTLDGSQSPGPDDFQIDTVA
jgi:hypothetical protein